jgi:transcriptional regulator of NAD metabolism
MMDGNKRREKLIQLLKASNNPISGGELANKLGVSRQVIVQDIALLRASDIDIISTTKGYLLYQSRETKHQRIINVSHSTESIEDELCTIVDNGGKVLDVHVIHEIYGQIVTDLIIRNRSDVYDFVKQVNEKRIVPLKELTAGAHRHTIEADSEDALDRIEEALLRKNYLIKKS